MCLTKDLVKLLFYHKQKLLPWKTTHELQVLLFSSYMCPLPARSCSPSGAGGIKVEDRRRLSLPDGSSLSSNVGLLLYQLSHAV